MKLLIITQKVDREDSVLGFFHRWIEEFSKHAESVIVICLYKGVYSLPPNVKVLSLGKEERESRIQYVTRFYSYIWKERKNYDSVFVHMNQEYILLGGMLWRMWRKKITLWYVHRQVNAKLRIAVKFSHEIFTSRPETLNLKSLKVNYLGHGIDISKYQNTPTLESFPKKITYVGRITTIKNVHVFIEVIRILNEKFPGKYQGLIVGEAITDKDSEYKEKLLELVGKYNLSSVVVFAGNKTMSEIPEIFKNTWMSINLSPTGGMDKTVLESLASNRPVFASNKVFEKVFSEYSDIFMIDASDPESIAKKIEEGGQRQDFSKITNILSEKVRKEYDVSILIGNVTDILNA